MTASASCIVPGIVRRGIDFNKVRKRLETDMDGMVRTAAKLKKKYIHESSEMVAVPPTTLLLNFLFALRGKKNAESYQEVSKESFQQLPLEGDNVCVMYFEEEVTFNSLEEKYSFMRNVLIRKISEMAGSLA